MTSAGNSLFLLSPSAADALARHIDRLGWSCVSVHRPGDATARFLAADARIAIVDTRVEADPADGVRRLGAAVESLGGALVALVDEQRDNDIDGLIAAGATHILFDGATDAVWHATLASAVELVRRLAIDWAPDVPSQPHSLIDPLTGLANRRAAFEWLAHAFGTHGAKPFCVLVGVSQYDAINAAYGQSAGDAILTRIAGRINRVCADMIGRHDLIARIAGTEFLIGLAGDAESGDRASDRALLLARQIAERVSRPFTVGDQQIQVRVRCGVAEAQDADDPSRLVRRAAAALADARRSGAGEISVRTSDGRAGGLDLDRLDADLRLALDRGEIGVVFQPQYGVIDGQMIGVEALARWHHPRLGELGAAVLFDAAQRSDYLLPLSRHIQREALRLAAEWPESLRTLRLAINVTAADLAQIDFVASFLGMVAQSGFPAARVTVEITESGLIENIEAASGLLSRLREQGLRVAMDDFGTGYSSLAYLKGLDLDYLKIDSGLTRDIAGGERDRVIVRGIIAMARSLRLGVIAEGVENEDQLALLAREGCDIYQGFLRSPAVDSAGLVALMAGYTA